ncbi:MAG TPA: LptF/LptG family permease [Tepidisphaeraceae bacterium]
MSRTLFWYIFKDLIRIFGLASGALSAIMSFGGLLRPLYEFGLDIGQVGAILGWSGPAMTAYSLPIAALFATTIVYGRFGADNEITACRAAGISHLSMALPALILGALTALISLVLLCFVVPYSMLKVERIIYSNIASLVAGQIERAHQINFYQSNKPITIFAQGAKVLPPDPKHPGDQAVQLYGPVFVQYLQSEKGKPLVPNDFYTASVATAYIRQDEADDQMSMQAELVGGMRFPRAFLGGEKNLQMSIEKTVFGPVALPSPVRENTKFMDFFKLKAVRAQPEKSRRVRQSLDEFITRDQQTQYLQALADQLNNDPEHNAYINGSGEQYVLTRGSAAAQVQRDKLLLGGELGGSAARLVQIRNGQTVLDVTANDVRIRATPDSERRRIDVDIEMFDCTVKAGEEGSARHNFTRPITVAMPEEVLALTQRPASEYLTSRLSADDRNRLQRDLYKLNNSIISEMYARVSFAVSCFILVAVGCALGMMFRSGNFLSAFAVSVIPALMCIALIVTGQHTAENVPAPLPANWTNTLGLGLGLIWSGNAIVLAAAVVLLGRLQRQ